MRTIRIIKNSRGLIKELDVLNELEEKLREPIEKELIHTEEEEDPEIKIRDLVDFCRRYSKSFYIDFEKIMDERQFEKNIQAYVIIILKSEGINFDHKYYSFRRTPERNFDTILRTYPFHKLIYPLLK